MRLMPRLLSETLLTRSICYGVIRLASQFVTQ